MPHRESIRAGVVYWPDVVASIAPLHEPILQSSEDLLARLASVPPPAVADDKPDSFDVSLAALAVLRGPGAVAPQFAMTVPALARVVAEVGDAIDDDWGRAVVSTLSYCNALRCCGAPMPDDLYAAEQTWLPQLADHVCELTEPERHTLALAACAAALTGLVPRFADLPETDEPFVPHLAFGFNVVAFAGYLATAIDHGATFQDVEPAWLDFVHRFPYKLDTGMLDWPALLWAARAVYTTIGQLPEAEVALEVHRLVTGL